MRRLVFLLPLTLPLLFALLFITLAVLFLIQVGIISYAYEKLGVPQEHILFLLLLSLLGSYINIPIGTVPSGEMVEATEVVFFGTRYRIPVPLAPRTVLAVNVGGALIPVLLSTYVLLRTGIWIESLIGIGIVSAVVHRLARPVPGLGIAMPLFIPPALAALTGLVLSSEHAPAVAYVSGTLGTLIGADLLNLKRVTGLGAPVASIGGAGTFDGIFLTGILAVLLS